MEEVRCTVSDAMLTSPVRHPLGTTVGEIRDFFDDDHVHAALIVGPAGYLAAVVERNDLTRSQDPSAAAVTLGRLTGRTVIEDARLRATEQSMCATGRRRVAVIRDDGKLVGLLCLKASRTGFCSEDDVRARAGNESGRIVVVSAETG